MPIGRVAVLLSVLLVLSNLWWFGYWLKANSDLFFAPVFIIAGIGTVVLLCVLFNVFIGYLQKHW